MNMNDIKKNYIDFQCAIDSSLYSANYMDVLKRNYKQFARTSIIKDRLTKTCLDVFKFIQLSDCTKISSIKLEQAFFAIEQYATRLLQRPNFREFENIKIYSGFFQLKIVNVLDDIWEDFFKRMGYKKNNNGTNLVLEYRQIPEEIAEVAFDGFLFGNEFHSMNQLSEKFSLSDVMRSRFENVGDASICEKWLRVNCTQIDQTPSNQNNSHSSNFKQKSREGSQNSNNSDWDDVYKDLRKRYGDKYYEGERGDFLKSNESTTTEQQIVHDIEKQEKDFGDVKYTENVGNGPGLLAAYLDDHGQLDSLNSMRVGPQKIKVKPEIHHY